MPVSFEKFKQLRSQGLSVDQIKRFDAGEIPAVYKRSGFFEQLGQNISQGTQNIESIPYAGRVLGPLSGFGAGIAKEIGQVGKGVATLGAKAFGTIPPEAAPSLEAKGIAETIGSVGAQIGEFAIPEAAISKFAAIPHAGVEALNLVSKFGKVGRAAEAILKAGITGVKEAGIFGGVEAVRTGGEPGAIKTAATTGGIFGAFGETARVLGLGKWIEKINMRLSPKNKEVLSNKMPQLLEAADKYGISKAFTPRGKFVRADKLYNDFEKELQSFLETNTTAKNIFVNKGELIDAIKTLEKTSIKDQPAAEVKAIQNQTQGAVDNIVQQYRGQKIPIDRLNVLKRNTWQRAFSKTGDKVLSDVELWLGDIYKSAIENSTQGLQIRGMAVEDFNKDYGKIINLKKIYKAAQFRPESAYAERVISSIAMGDALRGAGLGTAGFVGGLELGNILAREIATPIRTTVGRLGEKSEIIGRTITPLSIGEENK